MDKRMTDYLKRKTKKLKKLLEYEFLNDFYNRKKLQDFL